MDVSVCEMEIWVSLVVSVSQEWIFPAETIGVKDVARIHKFMHGLFGRLTKFLMHNH